MSTATPTATSLTFDQLSPAIQKAIRRAVADGAQTVGTDWDGRLHAEAQAYLGANGSPFASAVYEPLPRRAPSVERFGAPVYVLSDEIVAHLSA